MHPQNLCELCAALDSIVTVEEQASGRGKSVSVSVSCGYPRGEKILIRWSGKVCRPV